MISIKSKYCETLDVFQVDVSDPKEAYFEGAGLEIMLDSETWKMSFFSAKNNIPAYNFDIQTCYHWQEVER